METALDISSAISFVFICYFVGMTSVIHKVRSSDVPNSVHVIHVYVLLISFFASLTYFILKLSSN